jgi:hypothetical protein
MLGSGQDGGDFNTNHFPSQLCGSDAGSEAASFLSEHLFTLQVWKRWGAKIQKGGLNARIDIKSIHRRLLRHLGSTFFLAERKNKRDGAAH